MGINSIADLIGSSDIGYFLDETWGRDVCLYPQALAKDAGDIMSLKDFELILATLNRSREGWLHFTSGSLKSVPRDMIDAEGMIDLKKVLAAFSSGETLYLTKAERVSPSMMQLCRAIQLELMDNGVALRQKVNAHVFLTPPKSQGFPVHRDEHSSFILQLEGAKEWNVYEPNAALTDPANGPPRTGGVDIAALGRIKKNSYTLKAGDVLFIPEWWPHEALTSDSYSLHVTLRFFPVRWADMMRELSGDHPALAAAIPRGKIANPDILSEKFIDILKSQIFVKPLPQHFEEILRRQVMPRTVLPDDGFRRVLTVEHIESDTQLVRTAGTVCAVFETGDEVCIAFPGGIIRGPMHVKPVFEYVAETSALSASDLPSIDEGDYDHLDVAKKMVRDGLLRIADGAQ